MRDTGTAYEFYYDPVTKNIADLPVGFVQQDTGPNQVELKYLTELQTHAMAKAHGVSVDMVEGKTDREFLDAIQRKQKQENSKYRKVAIKPHVKEQRPRKEL